jgi:hypothetical protein
MASISGSIHSEGRDRQREKEGGIHKDGYPTLTWQAISLVAVCYIPSRTGKDGFNEQQ